MAFIDVSRSTTIVSLLILLSLAFEAQGSSRKLASLVKHPKNLLTYHNGEVLQGNIPTSILWYGDFTAAQKSIILDFLQSLATDRIKPQPVRPSVAQWWNTIDQTYLAKTQKHNKKWARLVLANQVSDDQLSIGKSLTMAQIADLAAQAETKKGSLALVFTAHDVLVEGFGMSRCGTHGSNQKMSSAYIWVGNPAQQCPGQCAWPFHQPNYGPQSPPLSPPNNDVGVDGMVINLARLLAGTVTNPYRDGFYQGPKDAQLEAATACPGVYGPGAYPGYAGKLLVDKSTGASYNANGINGRRYLVPALFDPSTSTCSTLL